MPLHPTDYKWEYVNVPAFDVDGALSMKGPTKYIGEYLGVSKEGNILISSPPYKKLEVEHRWFLLNKKIISVVCEFSPDEVINLGDVVYYNNQSVKLSTIDSGTRIGIFEGFVNMRDQDQVLIRLDRPQ